MSKPTVSEEIFENYLLNHRVAFERIPESTVPRPDYKLHVNPHPVIVEVKEFNASPNLQPSDLCSVSRIRERIKVARRKFALYQDQECCLVLFDNGSTVFLQPELVLRAMFGEQQEIVGQNAYRFSGLAEIRPHQNTRVSAVATLLPIRGGPNLLESLRRESGINDRTELTEHDIWRGRSDDLDCERIAVRVVVIENPFARKPLSCAIFSGPFDERWARCDDGSFQPVFSGERIAEMRSALPKYALRILGL
jgi:hypothetical protein